MPDPIRLLTNWSVRNGRPPFRSVEAGQIQRRDSLQYAAHLIGTYHLRVWFEPQWRQARVLAKQFPFCAVCSIPEESDTLSLRKIPAWRPRPDNGTV